MKSEVIAPASIQYYPLEQLVISDLNPRQEVNAEGIDLLADSLSMIGLVQNLSGLADASTGKIGIVAGGRRLRAIARAIERDPTVIERQPTLAQIPVQITFDADIARAWASAENAAREDLAPADEIRAYGRMKEAGADVPTIACTFGKTEAHVYRRLALAALPTAVLDALKAGEISLDVAKAFTVANDPTLAETVLAEVRGRNASAERVKTRLLPDTAGDDDRRIRFVGLNAYEEAGGKLTRDLFSEDVALHDIALLERLFAEKLDAEAAKIDAEWLWTEIYADSHIPWDRREKMQRLYKEPGELTEEQSDRYDELAGLAEGEALDEEAEAEFAALQAITDGSYTDAQRQFGGWFVAVDWHGRLELVGPYVRAEDIKAATEAGVLVGHAAFREDRDTAAPKSPISNALAEDLGRVVKGAKQHAILRDPELLIDLLAYQLSHDLAWRNPFGIAADAVPNWPTTEAEGYVLDDRLTSQPRRDMYGKDLGKSFRAFRAKGQDHIRAELTRRLAALFRGGDEQLDALIAKETHPQVREVWTPTAANFFGRVGGPYLNDLWCNLLDLKADHPKATSFAKLKKGEKAERMESLFGDDATRKALGVTDEQAARIDAWLPECME